jgi:cytochrome b561
MTTKPRPKGYSRAQIVLHWLVFGLIAFQIIGHEPMAEAWDVIEEGGTPDIGAMVMAHVLGGVLVLAFALWRIALRVRRGAPPAPDTEPELLRRAAHWGHMALYALMLVVPLSGMAAWGAGIMAAGEVHEVLKNLFIILILGHVAAALWHQFWLKDNLLARMKRPD